MVGAVRVGRTRWAAVRMTVTSSRAVDRSVGSDRRASEHRYRTGRRTTRRTASITPPGPCAVRAQVDVHVERAVLAQACWGWSRTCPSEGRTLLLVSEDGAHLSAALGVGDGCAAGSACAVVRLDVGGSEGVDGELGEAGVHAKRERGFDWAAYAAHVSRRSRQAQHRSFPRSPVARHQRRASTRREPVTEESIAEARTLAREEPGTGLPTLARRLLEFGW